MLTRFGGAACVVVFASWVSAPAADVPEKLQKEMEKAQASHAEGVKAAEKKLLDAFEAEKEIIRKQAGLKGEAKQKAIEAIDAEREVYEKHGTIPLSPRMRAASMAYLKSNRLAAQPLTTAYEKAIEFLLKAKDDAGAAAMTAEKKKVLKPAVAAALKFTSTDNRNSFTMVLYVDGTGAGAKQTWTLDKDSLDIVSFGANPPPGGWVDQCVFDSEGQSGRAKNQKGGVHNIKRVDPPKGKD